MDAQYYTHSSAQKNAVCRKELEFIPNGNFVSEGYEECRNMQFFQVMALPGSGRRNGS